MKHKKGQFSEWFSEIIAEAELADLRYNVKGFLVHRPWSVFAMKEMYRLYEKELERNGHEPVWLPAVIPEENLKLEKEHVEGFAPEVFWVSSKEDSDERIMLRPTSETAITKMFSLWTRSFRDLPMKLYHSCQVWRYETKSTRPFIRGREFHWIEAHDIFATREEAEHQVMEDMKMTENIMHREFGIPFMFFKRPEWDKFPGAVYTYAADTLMPDGRILQQPSTHLLGQNFSKPFGVRFMDRDEKEKFVWQTCYGPAIWRILASMIALHGDDKGLVFPFNIAPVQVVIIPVKPDKGVIKKCRDIEKSLSGKFRVKVDNSENTPGWKFNQWEMKGVPIRIEIGPKELENDEATLSRRDTGKREAVKESTLLDEIEKIGNSITKSLISKADSWFEGSMHSAKYMKDLESASKKGGFIKAGFCSVGMDGRKCAEKIKDKYHIHVRGERADTKEKPSGKCISCGKKATAVVYMGRQY